MCQYVLLKNPSIYEIYCVTNKLKLAWLIHSTGLDLTLIDILYVVSNKTFAASAKAPVARYHQCHNFYTPCMHTLALDSVHSHWLTDAHSINHSTIYYAPHTYVWYHPLNMHTWHSSSACMYCISNRACPKLTCCMLYCMQQCLYMGFKHTILRKLQQCLTYALSCIHATIAWCYSHCLLYKWLISFPLVMVSFSHAPQFLHKFTVCITLFYVHR